MKMLIKYVAGWSIEIDANPFTKVTEAVEETDTNGLIEEINLEGKVIFKRDEGAGFSPRFEIDKKYDPRPVEHYHEEYDDDIWDHLHCQDRV